MENERETSGRSVGARLLNVLPREDYERHLVESIDAIHQAAYKAAAPFIFELSRLRALDPPRPLLFTKEQADEIMKHIRPIGEVVDGLPSPDTRRSTPA